MAAVLDLYLLHSLHLVICFCSASSGISSNNDKGKIWYILLSAIRAHLEGMNHKVGS